MRSFFSAPQLKRGPLGSDGAPSMRLLERSSVLTALGVAAIAALVAWFLFRTERTDALAVTVCAQLYSAASASADTIRIDGEIPLQRSKGQLNPLTCGALRVAYPKQFTRTPP